MSMNIEYEGEARAPRDYNHPYEPYQIQLDLMGAIYDCIQNRQIGIFESPTGTVCAQTLYVSYVKGKSLSLICSALTWLRDHQFHGHIDLDDGRNTEEPEWVIEAAREDRRQTFLSQQRKVASHLMSVKRKELRDRTLRDRGEPVSKRPKLDPEAVTSTDQNSLVQYLVDDYVSDDEKSTSNPSKTREADDGLSNTTRELLVKLGMMYDPNAEDKLELLDTTKIFYCSRTHSQLIQFCNEVRRVRLKPLASDTDTSHEDTDQTEEVKHLSLGSRKNLCINPSVQRLGSTLAINEKCLQLQQTKSNSTKGCTFLPKSEDESQIQDFRDRALARVRDIEELAALGKEIGICPYYASRAAVKPSEIVTLPYPLMLQKIAREALGISLEGHVVVIDEAHNLMDAIAGIYSVNVSLAQLQRGREQLGVYLQKFRNKLKGKNRVYLAQLLKVIDSLVACLSQRAERNEKSGELKASELLIARGADQINLHKLTHYIRESKIARKADGYVVFSTEQEGKTDRIDPRPVLSHIEAFLGALTAPSAEGRFFFEINEDNEVQLKYLLLDSAFYFKDILEQARAVILLGGTMSPMDDYVNQLFPYVETARIKTLSCGHVIPDSNLLAWPIATSPSSQAFDFTFERRNQPQTISALGESIFSLIQLIPDGVVVFFPSYAYLESVTSHWKSPSTDLWTRLSSIKPIFSEDKTTSNVDTVLSQYSASISAGHGSLLLSVVGGKMSEGINFSDALGRGVFIVGLPFPNARSVEWAAKMAHVKRQTVARGWSEADGAMASRAFYENACMRAVNQSIGRAIRHKGDYACIVMFDRRYGTARIQDKLPGWIQRGLVKDGATKSFAAVEDSVREFFAKPR